MSFKIEHRIGVQTPPDQVWEVLTDLESWKDWNPLYTSAEGKIAIGSKLSLTLQLPGAKAEPIAPVVLDWVPLMQLVWRLRLSMLLHTTRYFELEPLNDGKACVISQGEIFDGFAARFMPKALRKQIRQGFEAMSEALKDEVHRRAGVVPVVEPYLTPNALD
jgi:hypothetical protein